MKTPLQQMAEQINRLSSEEELEEAGYKRYNAGSLKPHAHRLWQKKVRPGLFINIYTYSPIPNHPSGNEINFQPEAQLRSSKKCMNLTLLLDNESLEQIEEFFIDQADYFESKWGDLEN